MTETPASILSHIQSRGYWELVVRPETFVRERLELTALVPMLENVAIRMKGWDFPFVDPNKSPIIIGDRVEHGVTMESVLEYFRFYQSGQFIFLTGYREDWKE